MKVGIEMKKLRKMLVILLGVCLLCGCSMKSDYVMEIKSNKEVDMTMIMAFDDEFINTFLSMQNEEEQGSYSDEEHWNFLENEMFTNDGMAGDEAAMPEAYGYSKKRYEKDGFKGFEYTITVDSIDDITGDTDNPTIDDFLDIKNKKLFTKDGSVYKAKIKANDSENNEFEQYESQGLGIQGIFQVTLPSKPISHNATSVDGKTLTWDLTTDVANIEFEFKFTSYMPYIVGGVVVIVLLVGGYVGFSYLKKKKETRLDNTVTMFDNMGSDKVDNLANSSSSAMNMDNVLEKDQEKSIEVNRVSGSVGGQISNPNEGISTESLEVLAEEANESWQDVAVAPVIEAPTIDDMMRPQEEVNGNSFVQGNDEREVESSGRFFASSEKNEEALKRDEAQMVSVEMMFPQASLPLKPKEEEVREPAVMEVADTFKSVDDEPQIEVLDLGDGVAQSEQVTRAEEASFNDTLYQDVGDNVKIISSDENKSQ